MPDLRSIEEEILAGLPNQGERISCAQKNLEFYYGEFDRYTDTANEQYERTSLIMQRVVNVLTQTLYKDGPKRVMPEHEAATEWLDAIYRANTIDAQFQAADRLSCINQVAAFQVALTEDPEKPVKIYLWDASQFVVWESDDDPLLIDAVATIDRYDERSRLRLWTDETCTTFETEKLQHGQTAGGTAYKFTTRDDNALGVLPFSFVHFNFPTCQFWSGGLGDYLFTVNDYVNQFLTDQGDAIRYTGRPIITAMNVTPGWTPREFRPGAVWDIPATRDAAGNASEAKVGYMQADLGFIPMGWEDLNNYIDHALEMCGVPPATVRMVQTSARSGIAIVAEQIPLILWAKSRQRPFASYEDALAKLVLKAGSMHLGTNSEVLQLPTMAVTATEIGKAAEQPGLTLKWPEMFPDMPGEERDKSDQWELDNGLTSRIELLMKRKNYTREEAEAALEQIAADRAKEVELLAPSMLQEQGPADPNQPEPDPNENQDQQDEAQPGANGQQKQKQPSGAK